MHGSDLKWKLKTRSMEEKIIRPLDRWLLRSLTDYTISQVDMLHLLMCLRPPHICPRPSRICFVFPLICPVLLVSSLLKLNNVLRIGDEVQSMNSLLPSLSAPKRYHIQTSPSISLATMITKGMRIRLQSGYEADRGCPRVITKCAQSFSNLGLQVTGASPSQFMWITQR